MINKTIHELSDDATATNRPHAPPIIAEPDSFNEMRRLDENRGNYPEGR